MDFNAIAYPRSTDQIVAQVAGINKFFYLGSRADTANVGTSLNRFAPSKIQFESWRNVVNKTVMMWVQKWLLNRQNRVSRLEQRFCFLGSPLLPNGVSRYAPCAWVNFHRQEPLLYNQFAPLTKFD